MLIDAGMGDKNDARFVDLYGVDRSRSLDHTLAEAGVTPEDIDVVLATHLHFDHAGGFTVKGPDGRLKPRFPRARYVVRRGEWEDASHPNARSRASYVPDDFLPLAAAGVLELVDEDQTIMPGVKVRRAAGHTRHHQVVWLESNGAKALFAADLVPSAAHLPDAWIAGVDLHPVETLAAKQEILREAAAERALVFLEHDPMLHAGRILEQNGKRTIERLL
jgi:glyoxylase-like metal-dependent hydrolase (beta-lactamase superfamily II)